MEAFADVLAGAADGQAWAFEALWRDLQPPLMRYLRVAAASMADDVASETWLEVARHIRRFRGDEGDFRRWFFTIARHRAIDHGRKESRLRISPVPIESLGSVLDPADPIEEGASHRAALDIIAQLPKDQAEAVTLRVVAGLSVVDTARVMHKRVGAVRVLTHRGLRKLAEILDPPGKT